MANQSRKSSAAVAEPPAPPQLPEPAPASPPMPPPGPPPSAPPAMPQQQAMPIEPLVGPAIPVFPPDGLPAAFPPLGRTPTGVQEIIANAGAKATHFSGPVVSGGIPPDHMRQYVGGSALLSLALRVDWSMGSFNVPIQFPRDAILLQVAKLGQAAFSGTATVQLGTASGGSEILAAQDISAVGAGLFPVTGTLPGAGAAAPAIPGRAWLGAVNAGNTTGSAIVLLIFARVAPTWF